MKILIICLLFIINVPVFAAFPVLPVPIEEHAEMLKSDSPLLAANKRLAYDLYRVVMAADVAQLEKFVSKDLINHNPNEASGFEGLKEYIKKFLGSEPRPLKDSLDGLVSIFAEGDMVVLAFAREHDNPNKPGEKYTTTWFDMFRIVDGKMVEHWDPAKIKVE